MARVQAFSQKFPRVYTRPDFGFTADVVCIPNTFTNVGSLTVPAGQQVTFGVGGLGATDSREPCYIRTDTTNPTSTQCIGTYRFVLSNPTGTNQIVVMEQRSERLLASQNDKTLAVLLGQYPNFAQQDSKLIIQFKPDGASNVTLAFADTDTVWNIPVTVLQ